MSKSIRPPSDTTDAFVPPDPAPEPEAPGIPVTAQALLENRLRHVEALSKAYNLRADFAEELRDVLSGKRDDVDA